MSVGVVIEAEDSRFNCGGRFETSSTQPLKIPTPKICPPRTSKLGNSSTVLESSLTALTSPSNPSSASNPVVFKIDSRADSRINSFADFQEDGGESVKAGSENANSTKANVFVDEDAMNEFGTGYREIGTSSGFNSDLDSDSPFYSSDIDSDTSSEPPILWNFVDFFIGIPGNDWCVRIPQNFIEDDFNMFELPDVFHCPLTLTDSTEISQAKDDFSEYNFDDLLDFITIEDLTEDPILKISKEMLEDSILLYKLIHQRFIMTKAGLQAVWEKFEVQTYGTCPRYYCHDQPLLPVGPSALPGGASAKAYCLNCQDLYCPSTPRHAKMDGVAFGPSFAHFFVRTVLYANETKSFENRSGTHDWQVFVPKIYGFRIYKDPTEAEGIRTHRPTDFK